MAAENEYAAVCRSFPVLDGEKVGIVRLCSILHTSTQGETPKDGNFTFHAILDQIRYNSRHPDFAGATVQMTNIRNYNPDDGS